MAPLIRRRLRCFYCGRRSAQSYTAGLSQWQCTNCDAVNYLDEDGEITDPPAAVDYNSNVRFARQTERSTSPPSSLDSIFCQTCTNNQQFLAQNLADYLPPQDDPRYQEYVDNYATYKANLEERYPQVCEECEPKVRAKLRDSTYSARTELLRQMMEHTRNQPRTRRPFSLSSVILHATAVCWWLGLFGQVFWNGMGALAAGETDPDFLSTPQSLQECLQYAVQQKVVDHTCVNHAFPISTVSLTMALLTIWFNPTLLRGSVRRVRGLGEFYKLQIVLNMLRATAWYFLGGITAEDTTQPKVRGAHAVLLALNFVVSFVAYRTPTIDHTLQMSFPDYSKPLIPYKTKANEEHIGQYDHSSSRTSGFDQPVNPFPVNTLAPSTRSEVSSYPPTPPLESEDSDFDDMTTLAPSTIADSDAMDIDTPEQSPFSTYRSRPYKPAPAPAAPSPFHGILPPAPVSQAHRLRNPPNKPTFQKASTIAKQNYFGDIHGRGTSGDASKKDTRAGPAEAGMAPPRFFGGARSGAQDTGLESLFSSIFSLNDDPPELRRGPQTNGESHANAAGRGGREGGPGGAFSSSSGRRGITPTNNTHIKRLLSAPGLVLALYAWYLASAAPPPSYAHALQLSALGVAAAVAGIRLVDALRPSRMVWVLSDVLILGTELAAALGLAWGVYFSAAVATAPNGGPGGGVDGDGMFAGEETFGGDEKVGGAQGGGGGGGEGWSGAQDVPAAEFAFWFLAALTLQEVCSFVGEVRRRQRRRQRRRAPTAEQQAVASQHQHQHQQQESSDPRHPPPRAAATLPSERNASFGPSTQTSASFDSSTGSNGTTRSRRGQAATMTDDSEDWRRASTSTGLKGLSLGLGSSPESGLASRTRRGMQPWELGGI